MAAILAGVVAIVGALPVGVVAFLFGPPILALSAVIDIVELPWASAAGTLASVLQLAVLLEGSLARASAASPWS